MSKENLRFVHVGDLHIQPATEEIDPTLATINDLSPAPDLVMIGGDNVNSGMEAEYEAFISWIDRLQVPSYMVRGNHDRGRFAHHMDQFLPAQRHEPSEAGSAQLFMYVWNGVYWEKHPTCTLPLPEPEPSHYSFYDSAQEHIVVLRDDRQYAYSFEKKGWKFIVLDASPWILSSTQLQWLQQELEDRPSSPKLVFIHHNLMPCGICFDGAPVWNRWELLDLLQQYPAVKGVFNAHLHMNRIWNLDGLALITTGYRSLREVILGEQEIEAITPLEPYENNGHGQPFQNYYSYLSERFGRMFCIRDGNLWYHPVAGSEPPYNGFAWGEERCPEVRGVGWRFDVPPQDVDIPYSIRVNFACVGDWKLQVVGPAQTTVHEKNGAGEGEYRVEEMEVTLPRAGAYLVRLFQPGGQARVEGRVAVFAFAHRKDLRVADLQMAAPSGKLPGPAAEKRPRR